MKVLSDNTAQRLKTLLATPREGNNVPPPRRGAATVPPARMWQLHVIGDTVSIDGGFYLAGNGWNEFESAEIGEAFDGALVVGELEDGALAVSLKSEEDLAALSGFFRVFGSIHANEIETGFFVKQYESGPLYFEGADHWGAAKPLTELPADADGSWEARKNPTEGETASAVAESSLIELELDEEGRVSAKRYRTRTFDTHGNLIAISDRTESATPDPGGEEEPDPCGNPLNEGSEATDDDWDNPLEGGGEAGDEKDEESPREWDNPLDHEGDGGFTPPCRKN